MNNNIITILILKEEARRCKNKIDWLQFHFNRCKNQQDRIKLTIMIACYALYLSSVILAINNQFLIINNYLFHNNLARLNSL